MENRSKSFSVIIPVPVIWVLMTLFLVSCSTHKPTIGPVLIPPSDPGGKPKPQISNLNQKDTDPSFQRKIIVTAAVNSLGAPYKWGGQSPQTGFDCSGLIVYAHQRAHIAVPRTSKALFAHGKILSKERLKQADLVFFKPPREDKVLHVGIYIGDGVFIHAPGKNRKISYGNLNNPYFKKYYIGSRSYL